MQNSDQRLTEYTIDRLERYSGSVFSVETKTVKLSDGRKATRDVINHVGGASVVALDDEQNVILVRQFRSPYEEIFTEIPAGKLDAGEDPLLCAQRELVEETGFSAQRWHHLISAMPSPGYINEVIHIYLATELVAGEDHPDEGEFLDVFKCPLAKVIEDIASGKITDAKTVMGCLLAQRQVMLDE